MGKDRIQFLAFLYSINERYKMKNHERRWENLQNQLTARLLCQTPFLFYSQFITLYLYKHWASLCNHWYNMNQNHCFSKQPFPILCFQIQRRTSSGRSHCLRASPARSSARPAAPPPAPSPAPSAAPSQAPSSSGNREKSPSTDDNFCPVPIHGQYGRFEGFQKQ